MITGSCHCGAVRYRFDHTPSKTTSCNCSVCRRLGALWIYAKIPQIDITGATDSYAYGDNPRAKGGFHPPCVPPSKVDHDPPYIPSR